MSFLKQGNTIDLRRICILFVEYLFWEQAEHIFQLKDYKKIFCLSERKILYDFNP